MSWRKIVNNALSGWPTPFDRRGRSGALYRSARHEARGESRADRSYSAADAKDRIQSRRYPYRVFDQIRAGVVADRSKYWRELSLPFYSYNRPGAEISEGVGASFWLQSMMAGFPASYFCIKAFSETDLTEDLKRFDVPT